MVAIGSRTVGVVGLFALSLGVTACGGGGSSDASSAASSTSSSSASSAPASSSTSSSSSSAADPGKPSKASVEAGYSKFLQDIAKAADRGLDQNAVKKMGPCVVNKVYDQASADLLKTMASGDPNKLIEEKDPALKTANLACSKSLGLNKAAAKGSASSDAVIKAGASKTLPATVGTWTKPASSSGPASIYSDGNASAAVTFLPGGGFESNVNTIESQKTKAGTGFCGQRGSADNLLCYLKTADGVLSLSASSGDTPLPQLVSFANQLTLTLGTS